jgi:Tol biopolymer transport system component
MNDMHGNVRLEADAIRTEVAKIAASSGFSKSERLNRFLRLIVEETLAGRGDNIKEYVIGTEVYGRPQDYDPRLDATVRVEAAKLRKRLNAYYENEGLQDAVVIRIPKGCYRPEFEHRTGGGGTPALATWSRHPLVTGSIAVLLITLAAIRLWSGRSSVRGMRAARQRLISTFPGSHQNASFSPDGTLIAFVSRGESAGNESVSEVWIKALSEGTPIQITFSGTDAVRPRWSPRGDQIVFERRGQGIWSVPPLGGAVHRVIEDGRHASISPDGSQLLFVRRRELWIAGIDGKSQRRLDGLPERFFPMQTPPAFSPDGRWIAFFNAEVGPLGDIWVISVDGGRPRQITSDQAETRGLVWSRDSKWIIFSSARAGSFTLWRVRLTGGMPEPVTAGTGEDVDPALSPDGRRLLYTNTRTTQSLMLLDPASGAQTELFAQRETIGFPCFSPDGQRIAFFQPVDGEPHLFLVGTDGSGRQQISRGEGPEILPSWSNDGSSLYYYQVKPKLSFRKLELSGGASREVADWAYGRENWAGVDPLGHSAVYTLVGPKGPISTFVRDLTTGRETVLAVTLTRSQWSPDGRFVIGESGTRESGNAHVNICRPVQNECREVSVGLAPKWSADGLRIYYLRPATRLGWFDMWSASEDGSGEQRITTLGPFRADEVHFDVSRDGRIVWAPSHEGRKELWLADLH